MKIFKIVFFCFILFCYEPCFSNHFVGYDMCLVNIKTSAGVPTNFYKWRVKLFRDITGPSIPQILNFSLYKQIDNTQVGNSFQCFKINPRTLLSYPPEDCAPSQAQLSIELGIYETSAIDYSNLIDQNGYYVASSNCCRNPNILNVYGNSEFYGIVFTMDIPKLAEGDTKFNSSPEFKKNPLTIFSVGKPYTLNWDVRDPDGDSLVFSIVQPLGEGNVKPHNLIPYAPGYNINYNIIDGVPDLTINPRTGVINFIPTKAGRYLVAFNVDEWRIINDVPQKIGSIRREYQLEVFLNLEAPPVFDNINNQNSALIDTIFFPSEYTLNFTSRDSPNDSLFMYIVPNISPGENVLNPSTHNAKWGEVGNLSSGAAAENLVIDGKGVLQAQFRWTPNCSSVRVKPYKFKVIVRDQTCPSPFYDTTFVTLYLRKKENIKPIFINKIKSQPDDINPIKNNKIITRKYYIEAGDKFQLSGDSIIKTYDADSTQVVNLIMLADNNHNPTPTNQPIFNSFPAPIHSTATFYWQTVCADRSDSSYIFNICAYDDDCSKKDSVFMKIEIFIRDKSNRKPIFSHKNVDSVYIKEGSIDSFFITLYDTLRYSLNKYNHIYLVPDLTDFASVQPLGGSMLYYSDLDHPDSLQVKFTWNPSCANIRTEPYRLFLTATDDACHTLRRLDTVYVFALPPDNSPPYFIDKNDLNISIVDTSIYAGDIFDFDIHATDTSRRYDSVYISIDQTSDILNPSLVSNIATLISNKGKGFAKTELLWKTTCSDTKQSPYKVRVFARDNECISPEQQILTINILVKDRPNYLPEFTFTKSLITIDTIYAGESYSVELSALDSLATGLLTMDTLYTSIPVGLTKPTFSKVTGFTGDTLKSELLWQTDCSLISDNPYYIKLGTWLGPCTNIQDTVSHILKLYVLRNPLLIPKFTTGNDTLITLKVGEKFLLDLNAVSAISAGSIEITSTGDVYQGIPGNLAEFVQTGDGSAVFSWVTSCDHIRDSAYTVYFKTSNSECKTPEVGFKIKFIVLPIADLISPIPNAFSPNGDNINDTYSISKQYKVTCDPGFKFTVFNRWGKIVFESTNPEFEWSADGLGAGTYFYTLESRARSQNGTIDIIK